MLIKFSALILIILAGCVLLEKPKGISAEAMFRKERDTRIYSALRKFNHAMVAKGYRAAGIGEGVDPNTGKQKYVGVTFDIESLPNIEFARKVEIDALQELQKYINSEEGIQDYVVEYPYPINFLQITFISKERDKDLCNVSNFEETISYYKDEPGKPLQGPLIEIHSESYEEAVRILEKNQKTQ